MTDLDIDIDIPDDDDLHAPPPVLDNGDNPSIWPKLAAGVAIVVAAIGGYGYFTSPDPEPAATPPPATEPTPLPSAPTTTAVPDPAVTQMLAAVAAWERFATTGALAEVVGSFDSEGPQYALFTDQADTRSEPGSLRFTAAEAGIVRGDGLVTVSTDLTVTASDGAVTEYPYDFVFLDDSTAVWTVVDRRAPGSPALPPPPQTVLAVEQSWTALTDALGAGDLTTAATLVSATGDDPAPVFTETQLTAIMNGRLHTWTQINPSQVIASLEVDGTDIATVPFTLEGDRWLFDYSAASGIGSTR